MMHGASLFIYLQSVVDVDGTQRAASSSAYNTVNGRTEASLCVRVVYLCTQKPHRAHFPFCFPSRPPLSIWPPPPPSQTSLHTQTHHHHHHHHHTCTLTSSSSSLTSTPYTHWNLLGLQRKRCLKHTHILSVENAGRRALPATHLLCHITPWVGLMGGFCSVRSQTVGRI